MAGIEIPDDLQGVVELGEQLGNCMEKRLPGLNELSVPDLRDVIEASGIDPSVVDSGVRSAGETLAEVGSAIANADEKTISSIAEAYQEQTGEPLDKNALAELHGQLESIGRQLSDAGGQLREGLTPEQWKLVAAAAICIDRQGGLQEFMR